MELYGNQGDVEAFAGSLYGMNPKTVVTYPAVDEIEFGKAVFERDGKAYPSSSSGGSFAGVAVFHQCEAGKYLEKDAVAVMKEGYIWVEVEGEVSIGMRATVNNDTGKFKNAGSDGNEVGTFESDGKDGIALLHLYK